MPRIVRYLTHPQVDIDPAREVTQWSLNALGHERVKRLCGATALANTAVVVSSAERKAIETARPLAAAIGCPMEIRRRMHENDRSATGYLPAHEFEAVADQFFAKPDISVRGWETAQAAQDRIVREVQRALSDFPEGDVLFVGHGGVGTLLYCHLSGKPISRNFDQGPGGGGNVITFSPDQPQNVTSWQPMEDLVYT